MTGADSQLPDSGEDFNSHAHVERDSVITRLYPLGAISTHTLTWSVTQNVINPPTLETNFNSHAHVERD